MLRSAGCWVVFGVLAIVLAGCGGAVGPSVGLGSQGVPMGASRGSYAGNLLYVAHTDNFSDQHGVVSILTLPDGKLFASIKVGPLSGMCSDTSGNVWLVVWKAHPHGWVLDEYAHGGTTPIAEIRMLSGQYGLGCAVDPENGELAVMNPGSGSNGFNGSIDVWGAGYKGKPAVYDAPFVPENGGYDDRGNLFFDGKPAGSDIKGQFGELAKGSGAVVSIKIDRHTALPGGVQWDGQYFAFQTGGYQLYMKGPPRIYRIEISGKTGRVVGAVIPSQPELRGTAWFALDGDSVVSMAAPHGLELDLWPYPPGGPHTAEIGRFRNIRGLTISAGSSRR
jgi:hypothetical protein